MNVDDVVNDLVAEQAALDAIVAGMAPDEWELATPSPGWAVTDQIAHLAYFDGTAALAISDPDGFVAHREHLVSMFDDADAMDAATIGPFRELSPDERLAEWRRQRDGLQSASSTLGEKTRIEWYGPSMGAKSFLTARLMEVWAHGQDVCDTVGASREATDRLRHIAQLGFITRGWTYASARARAARRRGARRARCTLGRHMGVGSRRCSGVGERERRGLLPRRHPATPPRRHRSPARRPRRDRLDVARPGVRRSSHRRAGTARRPLMDFDLPSEDDPRRAEIRAWLADHPDPSNAQLHEAGYIVPHWPRPHGLDADPIHQLIIDDELRRAGVSKTSSSTNAIGVGWAAPTIFLAGTDWQKERFLPKIFSGEEVWCQLFSEPDSGSDLAGLGTRAVRDGDEYIINGSKIWSSGAHHSQFGILIARTDPDVAKHKGISYFILPMDLPGVELQPIVDMTTAHSFNQTFFTDVRLPAKYLVGAEGDGWRLAKVTLANERVSLSSSGSLWGAGPPPTICSISCGRTVASTTRSTGSRSPNSTSSRRCSGSDGCAPSARACRARRRGRKRRCRRSWATSTGST